MHLNLKRFLITAILYFTVCTSAMLVIEPQSIVNFIAPAAAVFSGLFLIWGATALVTVLLVTPLVAAFFYYVIEIEVTLAVMSISLLGIVLQGVWTRQLALRFSYQNKWLRSRQYLLVFLFRVGPLASLISATAVLIVSILDNETVQGTFSYTFISSWATSMLLTVFFIPLMLLNKHRKQLNIRKRFFVSFTSILGALAIFSLFITSQNEQQGYRLDKFYQAKQEIRQSVIQEVTDIVNQVESLSALFYASEEVDYDEFMLFSSKILAKDKSVIALEWAPLVNKKNKNYFEGTAKDHLNKEYFIKDKASYNNYKKAEERALYAPILYVYPSKSEKLLLGLDVYSQFKKSLLWSLQSSIIASEPSIIQQDSFIKPSVFFSTAVLSHSPNNNESSENGQLNRDFYGKNTSRVQGFVIAVVEFDRFFDKLSLAYDNRVKINVEDITDNIPVRVYGEDLIHVNRHTDMIELSVYSRTWLININEFDSWFAQEMNTHTWFVLLGGTLGALFFQILVLMTLAYSSELNQQVELKTQALTLAKNKSDKRSLAKTYFLEAFNGELRIPLQIIKTLVEQLRQKGINNKQVSGINHAEVTIAQLLDTMMDLSEIESGRVAVKNDTFDLYGLLNRVELVLKGDTFNTNRTIHFLIDNEVPHFINSDELRIQKLLTLLINNAQKIFGDTALRLSIKLHKHKMDSATLFFIFSNQGETFTELSEKRFKEVVNSDLASYSTSMAIIKEVCQLLQGNVNVSFLASGNGVLSASVKVSVSTAEQQKLHQAKHFDGGSYI
jgi:signal transduction histidine kinase